MQTDYDYDPIDRLTQATTKMNGTQLRKFDYTYDRHSNLAKDHTEGTTPGLNGNTSTGSRSRDLFFGYDSNDELCWIDTVNASGCAVPYGATGYTYDGAGALLGDSDGLQLSYNAIGQTSAMDADTSSSPGPVDMTYTGSTQDRRITAGTKDMGYGFSGLDRQTRTVGGSPQTDWFVRDPSGRLLAMVDADGSDPTRYYLMDAQDSVVATMATSGDARRYLYEPYGEQGRSWIDATPAANTSSGSTPPDGSEAAMTTADMAEDSNPWRYASGYLDTATGMLKFGARYYMPELARWTQIDPEAGKPKQPLTLNPYLYAGDDPINATDTSGRRWTDALGLAGDAIEIAGYILEGDQESAYGQMLAAVGGSIFAGGCELAAAAASLGTAGPLAAPGCYVGGSLTSASLFSYYQTYDSRLY